MKCCFSFFGIVSGELLIFLLLFFSVYVVVACLRTRELTGYIFVWSVVVFSVFLKNVLVACLRTRELDIFLFGPLLFLVFYVLVADLRTRELDIFLFGPLLFLVFMS